MKLRPFLLAALALAAAQPSAAAVSPSERPQLFVRGGAFPNAAYGLPQECNHPLSALHYRHQLRCEVSQAPSINTALQPLRLRRAQQRRLALLNRLRTGRVTYERVPLYHDLTPDQRRLVRTLPACPRGGSAEHCWMNALSRAARATFYMITYSLQHTCYMGRPLVEAVDRIEGLLVGTRASHTHELTASTHEVDGWRIHLMVTSVSTGQLESDGWTRWPLGVHRTHVVFDYDHDYRDWRERNRWDGPFLQLVLNDNGTSSDSDLDRGAIRHVSSPKELYSRFQERYTETRDILVIR